MWIIVAVIAFFILFVIINSSKKQTTKPLSKASNDVQTALGQSEINIPIKINVTTSAQRTERVKFPPLKEKGNDFVINPHAPIELTLIGSSIDTANEIRNILDDDKIYRGKKIEMIAALFAEYNLKIKEIDTYRKKYQQVYYSKINELQTSSEEWKIASEIDREDLIKDFRRLALKEVYEKADCDLITLFENEPKDITMDDELIKEYGFENIELYVRFADDLGKVRIIPNENYNRPKFEKLVQLGLAIRGSAIPKELILPTLTLKELNEIANHPEKQFKRKNQAIDYILHLTNIDELLNKKISFRELFKLNPLPEKYSHINLEDLSEAWLYTYEVVSLLISTYERGYYSYLTLQGEKNYISGYKVTNYSSEENICPRAKELINTEFTKSNPPKIPCHVGCTCNLQQEFNFK